MHFSEEDFQNLKIDKIKIKINEMQKFIEEKISEIEESLEDSFFDFEIDEKIIEKYKKRLKYMGWIPILHERIKPLDKAEILVFGSYEGYRLAIYTKEEGFLAPWIPRDGAEVDEDGFYDEFSLLPKTFTHWQFFIPFEDDSDEVEIISSDSGS